jgi:protein TonB
LTYLLREPKVRPGLRGIDGLLGAVRGIGAARGEEGRLEPLPNVLPLANNNASSKSGGQIQQAVLVYKKDPEYPKLARQTGARGAVKLTATVGKDGKVKSVKVLSGHPMLQAAAVEAVKQWVYKPTLLSGQPVETDTEIVLNFVGDR